MSNKIFENDAIIIIIILTILWLIGFVIIRKLEVGKDRKFELSIRNIAAMSVFLIIYNIYLNVRSNNRIEKNRTTYNTLNNIQDNWLAPQRELVENYPEGYFLYASMTPDAGLQDSVPVLFDAAKRKQLEIYCSIRIFQAMEDFLSTGSYDITGNYVWINNFLMWMQSPILQTNWQKLSFNYADDSREFINRIIEQSKKLNELRARKGRLTDADYDAVSKNFDVRLR